MHAKLDKNGGGLNLLGNGSLSVQQQLMLLQSGGGNSNADKLKMKGTEIVSSIQALVDDCEKVMTESGAGGAAHRATITKLEDKIEALQVLFVVPVF